MAVRQSIDGVAGKSVGTFLLADADKGELILGSAQVPHDVAGLPADFLDPLRCADKKVSIGILLNAIHVKRGNHGGAGVDPVAGERIMVPGSPLENDVPLRVQFLKQRASTERGR